MLVCLGSQNALPSDDDDKDPNDPHKALDIDLDKYVPHFRHLQFIHVLHIVMCRNDLLLKLKFIFRSLYSNKLKQL